MDHPLPPQNPAHILVVYMRRHSVLAAKKLEVKIASNKLERQMKQMSLLLRDNLENKIQKQEQLLLDFFSQYFLSRRVWTVVLFCQCSMKTMLIQIQIPKTRSNIQKQQIEKKEKKIRNGKLKNNLHEGKMLKPVFMDQVFF